MGKVTVDKTPVSNVETPQNFGNKQVELTVNGDNRAASSDSAYTVEGLTDGSKGSVSIPYGQSAALILEIKSAGSVSNSI